MLKVNCPARLDSRSRGVLSDAPATIAAARHVWQQPTARTKRLVHRLTSVLIVYEQERRLLVVEVRLLEEIDQFAPGEPAGFVLSAEQDSASEHRLPGSHKRLSLPQRGCRWQLDRAPKQRLRRCCTAKLRP